MTRLGVAGLGVATPFILIGRFLMFSSSPHRVPSSAAKGPNGFPFPRAGHGTTVETARLGKQERCAMADFPVHAEQEQIVNNDGNAIAKARTQKTVEDLADRLNAEEDRREEDRWSV
jgi:hypothetical protein